MTRLTAEQNAAIIAQLSPELEPSTPLPDWNAVAMETVYLRNRIAALEAQIAAAGRWAETLADNLTWVLPMAKGYAHANPHDVNKRLVAGAETDLAAYLETKEPTK